MKKLIAILMAAVMTAGCAASSEPAAEPTAEAVGLKILAPTGAPAYALVPAVGTDGNDVTFVDGSDVLQAAFVSAEPAYDVIVAPTNLGVKIASAGSTSYRLAGVVTTGNLYLVGTDENVLTSGGTLALFGEGAVPGLVYRHLFPESSMEEVWYSSVQEAQAALLSGNADAALLAEPAATAAIAKAAENGTELKKICDLQELWGENGYPQAGLFVSEEAYEEKGASCKALMDSIISYADEVRDGTADLAADVEAAGADQFGGTPAAMAAKAYTGMGINPYYADEDTENLKAFLSLFNVTLNEDVIVSLQ